MSNKKFSTCDYCANTGLLKASLIENSETGARHISTVICGDEKHTNDGLADKNITAMQKTGLPVEVSGVRVPSEKE